MAKVRRLSTKLQVGACKTKKDNSNNTITWIAYLISTVLFARQNTSYTHIHRWKKSFHPSLTLVPSLANYSLSLYTPPSLGSPSFTTPFPSFHFLAVQREHLSVPLFLCFRSFSLWITIYWFYLWLFFIELCHSDLFIHAYIIFSWNVVIRLRFLAILGRGGGCT